MSQLVRVRDDSLILIITGSAAHLSQALVVMVLLSPSHANSRHMFPLLNPAGGGMVEPVPKLRPPAGLALWNCTGEVQGLLS